MSFDQIFSSATAKLHRILGREVTYIPAVGEQQTINAQIDIGVEEYSEFESTSIEVQTQITMPIIDAKKHDTVDDGELTYTLIKELSNDGFESRWQVK